MSLHVVVGAGAIGSGVATLLANAGEQVRVVTRRGGGPVHPAVERVAADAADAHRLASLARGAVALYNCANPPYHRWPTDWPPIADSLLAAAETAGAVLVTTANLYGYGPVDRPMTEEMPLAATGRKGRVRAGMWHNALAAHEAGRVCVTEARAGDYLGAGSQSLVGDMMLPALRAGRTARVPASLDQPHTFTYTGDVARTLVTLATDERAWGRPWHVPSNPALTLRQLAAEYCAIAGAPAPRLARYPRWSLRAIAPLSPLIREFVEISYQFEAPFVMDSTLAERTFGLKPTPLSEVLSELITG